MYIFHSCSNSTFPNNLQNIIQQFFEHCPIIIMRDFNVDILKNNNQVKKRKELLYFMDKFQLKSQFRENNTKVGFQLDHIRANVPINECKCSKDILVKFSQIVLFYIQITKHTFNV